MSPVHRLGQPAPPAIDRLLAVIFSVELLDALDQHIANRLELDVTAEHRDEVIEAALRAHLDFWPEQAPAGVYRVDGRGQARARRRRVGPAASDHQPKEA